MRPLINKVATFPEQATMYVAGNVTDVLQGTVTATDLKQQNPAEILFALGTGSFHGKEAIGEAMIFNGQVYIKLPGDKNSVIIENSEVLLKTPFSVGIETGNAPTTIYHFKSKKGKTIGEIYQNILSRYNGTLAIFAQASFSTLETTVLCKPPIFKELMTAPENKDKYLAYQRENGPVQAICFGVVTAQQNLTDSPLLNKVFYVNPEAKIQGGYLSYTQLLKVEHTLNLSPRRPLEEIFAEAGQARVKDLRHLLDQSICTEALLVVYQINEITEYSHFLRTKMVDIATLDPSILLDIRYATTNNFTGQEIYPSAKCYFQQDIAQRLVRVNTALRKQGLRLKIFDGYRPLSVQYHLWEIMPNTKFIANPATGSIHNRGAAVDCTLAQADGTSLPMPSDYDDFSEKAYPSFQGCSEVAKANRALLEKVMVAEGFKPIATEWWHFDGPNWQQYPIVDLPMQ
jgi:D-alanyl-D-alanine dipeptidase